MLTGRVVEILIPRQSDQSSMQSQTFEGGVTMLPGRLAEILIPRQLDESSMQSQSQSHSFSGATRQFDESGRFEGGVTMLPRRLQEILIPRQLDESSMQSQSQSHGLGSTTRTFVGSERIQSPAIDIEIDRRVRRLKTENVGKSSRCTICLDGFMSDIHVKCMPCLHLFHEDCIVTWLKQCNSCPVCRFEL